MSCTRGEAYDELYEQSLTILGVDATEPLRLHAALQRLLPALADHDVPTLFKRRGGISPVEIVSLPWHRGRLADCRRQRAAGTTPPPVHVTRVRIHRHTWYLVTDGMHRAWAAREAGVSRLGAYIDGEVTCSPEAFQLSRVQGRWELWRRDPPRTFICDVFPAWLPIARALGVRCDTTG